MTKTAALMLPNGNITTMEYDSDSLLAFNGDDNDLIMHIVTDVLKLVPAGTELISTGH